MFDNTGAFVKYFNELMVASSILIRMTYIPALYEIRIQHLDGTGFSLEEYYDEEK